MNPTEHAASDLSRAGGFLATVRDLIHGEGTRKRGKAARSAPEGCAAARRGYAPAVTRRLSLLACLPACLAALAFLAGPASAFVTHDFLSSLTGFSHVSGVAADGSSDLYVADGGAMVVDRFGPSGSPLAFSASEPYVEGAKLKGTPTGAGGAVVAFAGLAGVAVNDTTGDVYVADPRADVVDVFASSGEYLDQLTGTPSGPFGSVSGVAVDQSSGDVFIADAGAPPAVDVFNSVGQFVSQFGSGVLCACEPQDLTVAVNDFSEDVYVAEYFGVAVFNGPGEVQQHWGGGQTPRGFAFPVYMAVDQHTGRVYVGNGYYGEVDEFASSTTEEFLGRVTGTPSGAFGQVGGVAIDPVSNDLYVAAGEAVDVFGPDLVVPDVTTGAASNITGTGVTLNGTVNPDGVEVTSCEFEYGTTTSYGHTASCETEHGEPVGAGTEPVPVHASLAVQQNTLYHYRLVAANANGEHEGADATFTTPGPPVVVSESAEVPPLKPGQTSVTLQASINPDGRATTYVFEYGETTSYGTSIPVPPGEIEAGGAPVVVSAEVTGLKVGTTYHYRVVAHNEYSTPGTGEGSDQTVTTTAAALVEAWSTDVRSTSATLYANINPLGTATEYRFVYGPCGSGECSAPVPDEQVGSGEAPVEVQQHLNGLTAGQTYHYHVIATNSLGTKAGETLSFTTQTGGAAGLPDGRGWELVSPPDKHGAALFGANEYQFIQAAADGSGIVYPGSAPTEGRPQGDGEHVQVLARREASGWGDRDLGVPQSFPTGLVPREAYPFFSSDLSLAAHQPMGSFGPALSSEATEQGPYLRDSATGLFTPLVIGCRPDGECPANRNDTTEPFIPFGEETATGYCVNSFCGPEVMGATPDLSYIVLNGGGGYTPVPLLQGTSAGSLYEWAGGKLALVGSGEWLGGYNGHAQIVTHAVSDDGSRVFWSQNSGPNSLLFMRDMVRKETIEIGGGEFEGANTAGTLVFYSGRECEILLGAKGLECRPVESEGKPVEDGMVLTTSEDGAWVYFRQGESLFLRHDNEPARLLASATGNIRPVGTEGQPQEDPWRASPNGQWLAFMSDSPLTGYDNRDAVTGRPDEEVYLYSATAGRLVCASCDPTGARPHGTLFGLEDYAVRWEAKEQHLLAASVPGWGTYHSGFPVYDPRFVSDSGRLFFNAVGGLVPRDVNGQVDVYELEPPGVGGCATGMQTGSVVYSPAAGGCVALISNGESAEESVFEDASESGDDVFFLSSSRLSTADLDGSLSMWDAHVCTGSRPCIPAPAAPVPPCSTESSCKPSQSPQPQISGEGPSETFSGPANAAPAPPPPPAKGKTAAQVRAEKLARALKVCHKDRSKVKRKRCEKQARQRYGARMSAKKSANRASNERRTHR